MRVLHVSDCYLPRLGGIEMHVHDLAAQQRAHGLETLVVTATDGDDLDGVRRDRRLAGVLDDWRPDVVHTHLSVISPLATRGTRLASSRGLPTVATAHSLWPQPRPVLAAVGAGMGLAQWPVLWSAVSGRAAGPLRALVGDRAAVTVLPNAVDAGWWFTTPRTPDVTTVISVMRLSRRKRPMPLLRLLRDLRARVPEERPLRALIVGDGPDREGMAEWLRRHRMTDWVRLTGALPRPTIRDLLAASSFYLAPATLESFGIAALEARAAGLPVVASSRGGVGEFVTHGVDGLLAGSDAGLVDAMARLVLDEGMLAAMTAHNRATPPMLDWETVHEMTLDAYARAERVAQVHRTGTRRLAGVGR